MSVGPLMQPHSAGYRGEELRHSGLLALMHSPLRTWCIDLIDEMPEGCFSSDNTSLSENLPSHSWLVVYAVLTF